MAAGAPREAVRRGIVFLRQALECADIDLISGPDALEVAELFCEAERVACAGKARYARRVERTGAHEARGHRDTSGWLSEASGESVGRSRDLLAVTEQVEKIPALAREFAAGGLSRDQAKVIAGAAGANPSAVPSLLEAAKHRSFSEMKTEATRVLQNARGEQELRDREARVHSRRYCRLYELDGGGVRLDGLFTKAAGARLSAALEAEVETIFDEARATGEFEDRERYRADALVRLVCGGAGGGVGGGVGRSGPGAHVVVRVDIGALVRGEVRGGGELCEIPGVGPVPVSDARSLLGDAWFNLVLSDGIDVRCVTSSKRTIPAALRVALFERDPVCVVPGCGVSHHLEIDHWRVDFCRGGPTCLDNLARLCGRHHTMKSTLGWRLAGGPGAWKWLAPVPLRT